MSILSDFPALATLDVLNTSSTLDLDSTDHSVPFAPSPEDEAAYLALLAGSDDHDDIMVEHLIAAWEATLADHHDRWGFVSEAEMIECRGHHPYLAYDA